MARNPDKKQCSAHSKRTGERCKNYAVRGKNVCRFHGGRSKGAPKNNKYALKTGEHEKILLETLDQDEKEYYFAILPDPIKECEEKIRLLKVRELRIMRRIKDIRNKMAADGGKETMVTVSSTKSQTIGPDGDKSTSVTGHMRAPEMLLAETEEALTRVQNELGRWVDRLATYREKYGSGDDDNSLNITFEVVNMRADA